MPLAIVLGIIGVCFVAGYVVTYGGRPYVALIGVAFIVAAAVSLIPAEQHVVRYGLIGVVALLLLSALLSAIVDMRHRLARLREESAAREAAFFETFQATEAKQREQEEEKPPQQSAPSEGEGGPTP